VNAPLTAFVFPNVSFNFLAALSAVAIRYGLTQRLLKDQKIGGHTPPDDAPGVPAQDLFFY